jgi:23S rRNA pseudouridine2604 synthase
VRVNKWLAQAGLCSRREADAHIAAGRVRIDGQVVTDAGRKLLPGQRISLAPATDADGTLQTPVTYVLHKPVGYVSAQPEPGKGQTPAVRLLTPERRFGPDAAPPGRDDSLAPLGRLDADSRGLLLLSTDGVLAKALIGPDSRLEKEYLVRVAGEITPEAIALLRHGLELDGRPLRPARIFRKGPDRLRFILSEGRNRQIRRMCELVGLRVTDLWRTSIGPLALSPLPEGQWRRLGPSERETLLRASRGETTPQAQTEQPDAPPRPTLSLRAKSGEGGG